MMFNQTDDKQEQFINEQVADVMKLSDGDIDENKIKEMVKDAYMGRDNAHNRMLISLLWSVLDYSAEVECKAGGN